MNLKERQKLYGELIEYLQKDYYARTTSSNTINQNGVTIGGCDFLGNQINLWSYWQGSLEAKILLVGQDWGTLNQDVPRNKKTKENVQKIAKGEEAGYFDGIEENDQFETDKNIKELFKSLGNKYTDLLQKNKDLFFTNLCLGYRSEGNSKGFRVKWLRDDVKYLSGFDIVEGTNTKHISGLLEIIKPDVVICLGKKTYEVLIRQYSKELYANKQTQKNISGTEKTEFNLRLDNGNNYQDILCDGKEIRVYAVAHPSPLGMANRGRNEEKDGRILQHSDWCRIGKWLENKL